MMKKILLAGYSILALTSAYAQPVIVELFQKVGSASTAQVGRCSVFRCEFLRFVSKYKCSTAVNGTQFSSRS